jgi:hypothetical protein
MRSSCRQLSNSQQALTSCPALECPAPEAAAANAQPCSRSVLLGGLLASACSKHREHRMHQMWQPRCRDCARADGAQAHVQHLAQRAHDLGRGRAAAVDQRKHEAHGHVARERGHKNRKPRRGLRHDQRTPPAQLQLACVAQLTLSGIGNCWRSSAVVCPLSWNLEVCIHQSIRTMRGTRGTQKDERRVSAPDASSAASE